MLDEEQTEAVVTSHLGPKSIMTLQTAGQLIALVVMCAGVYFTLDSRLLIAEMKLDQRAVIIKDNEDTTEQLERSMALIAQTLGAMGENMNNIRNVQQQNGNVIDDIRATQRVILSRLEDES